MPRQLATSSPEWQQLFEQMSKLQEEVESLCGGRPLDQAEGTRYLARLLASALSRFDDRGRPAIDWATPRIGGFNPDYRFGHARIDPRGTYRLLGKMNDASRLALSTHAGALGNARPIGHLASREIGCDVDGRFEVEIRDQAPPPPRSWLPKSSATNTLMIRQLLLRRSDRPAEIALQRIDAPDSESYHLLTPQIQRERMGGVVLFVVGAAQRFFRWTRLISARPNTIEQVPAEIEDEVKADPDTFYAIGYFDLGPGERLEVRITPPPCEYWGLHTTNHWLEPIQHDSLTCHHNHATATPAPDGSFTLSISPVESSHPNALHTLGHHNGAIFFRVVGAGDQDVALPTCTPVQAEAP